MKRILYRLRGYIRNRKKRLALRKRDVYVGKNVIGLKHVNFEGECGIPDNVFFNGNIKVGKNTTFGMHNFIAGDIEIGRYCQIGAYVAMHSTNHPISYMTTYINKRLFNGELSKLKNSDKIVIRNDVWIGHGAIILSGVKIGNGAIIAAGSVVTKDVDSYSIVAGNPAKFIRYRFDESTREKIENLKWWNMNNEELKSIKDMFFIDLKSK